MELTKHPDEY